MDDRYKLLLFVVVFGLAYFVPMGHEAVGSAILASFQMLQDYARHHVLFCLVPAFFIAGAISVFLRRDAIMRYLGPEANRVTSYLVASVSGAVLAVCSCTVLPLFAAIHRAGAGIGPASAFLYSGPAINVLAIILTARILGWQLGLARAVAAVVFALVIGLAMSVLFREERQPVESLAFATDGGGPERPGWQTAVHVLGLIVVLVFAAWAKPAEPVGWAWAVYRARWFIALPALALVVILSYRWFDAGERREWVGSTWEFAALILPLLFVGVLIAGFLMGMPGEAPGIIPERWIAAAVGGNSLDSNLLASVAGAFMYFATLTEVPIVQGLAARGMGQGPALALLLAGPALSLPNMLVIRGVMGTQKTVAYVILVVSMATVCGLIYGSLVPVGQ